MEEVLTLTSACFFGHRDVPVNLDSVLMETITDFVKNKGVTNFYVGNNGRFDDMVLHALKRVKQSFPNISYCVVLSYYPQNKLPFSLQHVKTVFPAEVAAVPKKVAIIRRNKWMIDHSEFVVSYVRRNFGGAASAVEYAKKKERTVISL